MKPSTTSLTKDLRMRSFPLALALWLSSLSACSLLLDTESLQKKGGIGGTGGSSGSGGSGGGLGGSGGTDASTPPADANPDGSGQSCQSDIDCLPQGMITGCILYACGADKTCLPPRPYSGLAVDSVAGDVEVARQANDIGHPSLLADQTDIVLSAWERNGTVSNLILRRYDERPNISPLAADLNAIAPARFEGIASSAGMMMRALPRRVRLFLAARLTGAAATGMHQVDVDLATLRLSAMQPMRADVGVTGYDTSPRGPVPRLLAGALPEPAGMWIQQGKLFHADATATGEAFAAKRVVGFAPIAASAGLHAALETTDLTNPGVQGATELWTRGVPSLTSLSSIGDQLGAVRRGVAAVAINEGLTPLNLVIWAFERAGTASLQFAGAACDLTQCTAAAAPMTGQGTLPATFPEAASARVTGSNTDRDLAVMYQIAVPDPGQPTMAHLVLLGGISRVSIGQGDAGGGIISRVVNPASFVIYATTGPATAEILGPSAIAMTSGGLMMAAWVERLSMNQVALKTRRFQVKTCPAP